MDLNDIYHELSYDVPGVSGPEKLPWLLEDWVTRSPIFSLGPHTEKQLKGWKSVRNVLRTLSKEADSKLFNEFVGSGVLVDQPKWPGIREFKRNDRSDDETKLLTGVIARALKETERFDESFGLQGGLHAAVGTQLPNGVAKFANIWQFVLKLPIDVTFLKALLDYLHEAMTISKDHRIAAISRDWDYLLPNLSGGERLYFAYGSNMNKQQMAQRTASSRFLGLADLPNFEFFIDNRGVASVRPRVGKSVKGMLWDIQETADWQRLDQYEGVGLGYYHKLNIPVLQGSNFVSSTIYVSAATKEGVPRPGYQEGIVKAVVDENHRSEGLVEGLYDEDFPEINTEGFKDWESEMKGWLAQ